MKEVSEKYTQRVTAPTQGFDCHASKGFSTVRSHTSSFLAFQRTQVRGWTQVCVSSPSLRHVHGGPGAGSIIYCGFFLFVCFEQCYLYEFVGDGSHETVQCPSAAFLYAIVSFSYNDPKLTLITAEYKRYPEMKVSSV